MNDVSDNPKRLSTCALQAAARSRTIFIALLLLPAISGVPSTLRAQGNAGDLALITYADTPLDRVCAGDSVEFSVIATRIGEPGSRINEVLVMNNVLDEGIGVLSPRFRRTWALYTPSGSVPFTFKGLRPGTTELSFDGVMFAGGPGNETDTLKRRVTVISCGSPNQPGAGAGVQGRSRVLSGRKPADNATGISKINVTTRSTWSVGMDIRATIENGVMVADGRDHFDGSASVT